MQAHIHDLVAQHKYKSRITMPKFRTETDAKANALQVAQVRTSSSVPIFASAASANSLHGAITLFGSSHDCLPVDQMSASGGGGRTGHVSIKLLCHRSSPCFQVGNQTWKLAYTMQSCGLCQPKHADEPMLTCEGGQARHWGLQTQLHIGMHAASSVTHL